MERKRPRRETPFTVWLNQRMGEMGLGPAELARQVGVRHQLVSAWAAGISVPNPDAMRRLARFTGYRVQDLLGLTGRLPAEVEPQEISFEDALRLVQMKAPVSLKIEGVASAGPGAVQDDIYRPPSDRTRNLRAIEIVGDCLEPEVSPGDAVTIDLDARWEWGSMVVAKSEDGYIVKRYYGDLLHDYKGTSIPSSTVDIIGVVIDVRKRIKPRPLPGPPYPVYEDAGAQFTVVLEHAADVDRDILKLMSPYHELQQLYLNFLDLVTSKGGNNEREILTLMRSSLIGLSTAKDRDQRAQNIMKVLRGFYEDMKVRFADDSEG